MNVPFRPPGLYSQASSLFIGAFHPTHPGLFAPGLVNLQFLVGAV